MQFDTTPSQSPINHKMANENGEISPPPKKRGQPINDNNIYLLIEDVNLPSSNQSNCAKKVTKLLPE